LIAEWVGEDVVMRPSGAAVRGEPRLPGSKSITNRALFCAALADGRSRLEGASSGSDADRMVDALAQLGVRVEREPEAISVNGCRGQIPALEGELDVHDAGTAMRFLTAFCTLGHGRFRIDGTPRMRQRPIAELVDGLRDWGAAIGYDEAHGCPPLTIVGRGLRGGTARVRNPASSQFLSAMLMAGPYASDDALIEVSGAFPSRPYADMTRRVMEAFGAAALASDDGMQYAIPAGQRYAAREYRVEPDASAACYFWAAAAITGGSVTVRGLGSESLQGDAAFAEVLRGAGCAIEVEAQAISVRGPAEGGLGGVDVDLNAMPDTAQTLAVVALFAEGPTRIRNVANLAVKETNRLEALERELTRLGARVERAADGLTITPPERVLPATIETYDDHRMAMSFALAGLRAEGIRIRNAGCTRKSFPEFFRVLGDLTGG